VACARGGLLGPPGGRSGSGPGVHRLLGATGTPSGRSATGRTTSSFTTRKGRRRGRSTSCATVARRTSSSTRPAGSTGSSTGGGWLCTAAAACGTGSATLTSNSIGIEMVGYHKPRDYARPVCLAEGAAPGSSADVPNPGQSRPHPFHGGLRRATTGGIRNRTAAASAAACSSRRPRCARSWTSTPKRRATFTTESTSRPGHKSRRRSTGTQAQRQCERGVKEKKRSW